MKEENTPEVTPAQKLLAEFPPIERSVLNGEMFHSFYTSPTDVVVVTRHPHYKDSYVYNVMSEETRKSLAKFFALEPQEVEDAVREVHAQYPTVVMDELRNRVLYPNVPAGYLPKDIEEQFLAEHPEFAASLEEMRQALLLREEEEQRAQEAAEHIPYLPTE